MLEILQHPLYVQGFKTTIIHAENPDNPGYSFCGIVLGRNASPSNQKCVICEELTRRGFYDR